MTALWIASGGPWIQPMLNVVKGLCNIVMLIPEEGDGGNFVESIDGVKTYHLALPKGEGVHTSLSRDAYALYAKIIDEVCPDIIHVHGTEINFGQIQNYQQKIPVVISIQGLLSGCLKYNTAFIKPNQIKPFMSLKNKLGRGGLYQADNVCNEGVKNYELDILTNGHYFFGRTNWDKAHVEFLAPQAKYFKGEELLRPVFYSKKGSWNISSCDRHSVFMPSGFNPLKGMHIAIEAISLLKHYYPDVVLRVPGIPIEMLNRTGIKKFVIGEDFLGYVKHIVETKGLKENVVFLPFLNGDEMAEQMLRSNVFLSCSTIDNSSNAVGEATMLGMPIVTTAVGGIISFMHDEDNCLYSASGDEFMIAHQIKRLFEDDELANELAHNAFQTALRRHDIVATGHQYLDAYKKIISIHNSKN